MALFVRLAMQELFDVDVLVRAYNTDVGSELLCPRRMDDDRQRYINDP